MSSNFQRKQKNFKKSYTQTKFSTFFAPKFLRNSPKKPKFIHKVFRNCREVVLKKFSKISHNHPQFSQMPRRRPQFSTFVEKKFFILRPRGGDFFGDYSKLIKQRNNFFKSAAKNSFPNLAKKNDVNFLQIGGDFLSPRQKNHGAEKSIS